MRHILFPPTFVQAAVIVRVVVVIVIVVVIVVVVVVVVVVFIGLVIVARVDFRSRPPSPRLLAK